MELGDEHSETGLEQHLEEGDLHVTLIAELPSLSPGERKWRIFQQKKKDFWSRQRKTLGQKIMFKIVINFKKFARFLQLSICDFFSFNASICDFFSCWSTTFRRLAKCFQ